MVITDDTDHPNPLCADLPLRSPFLIGIILIALLFSTDLNLLFSTNLNLPTLVGSVVAVGCFGVPSRVLHRSPALVGLLMAQGALGVLAGSGLSLVAAAALIGWRSRVHSRRERAARTAAPELLGIAT